MNDIFLFHYFLFFLFALATCHFSLYTLLMTTAATDVIECYRRTYFPDLPVYCVDTRSKLLERNVRLLLRERDGHSVSYPSAFDVYLCDQIAHMIRYYKPVTGTYIDLPRELGLILDDTITACGNGRLGFSNNTCSIQFGNKRPIYLRHPPNSSYERIERLHFVLSLLCYNYFYFVSVSEWFTDTMHSMGPWESHLFDGCIVPFLQYDILPKPPTLEVGSEVEVSDLFRKWYPAIILQKSQVSVLVHFKKWASDRDEVVMLFDEFRFAPKGHFFKWDVYDSVFLVNFQDTYEASRKVVAPWESLRAPLT